jgi:hypothetical protein
MTFGAEGVAVHSRAQRHTFRVRPDALEAVLRIGLVYTLDVPIAKAGGYQMRSAVRDAASGKVGSASQYVEVPEVGDKRLALSGIVMARARGDAAGDEAALAPRESTPGDPRPDLLDNPADADASPALRRFARGTQVSYACFVYNPWLDPKTRRPRYEMSFGLFLDGREVQTGAPVLFAGADAPSHGALASGGKFRLDPALPPGLYGLEVRVRDAGASRKRRAASQWTEFEVKPEP